MSPAELADLVVEEHVARSTALHARLGGRDPYLTGPLARYALNVGHPTPLAAEAAPRAGLGPVCTNPFRSIVVRAVELVFACEEALSLVESYVPPDPPAAVVVAHGRNRAPARPKHLGVCSSTSTRSTTSGTIRRARIVPPTSQNQLTIEADLRRVVQDASGPERRRAAVAVRADRAESRPMHLVRCPLPRRHGGVLVTGRSMSSVRGPGTGRYRASWWPGLGNEYRRDDGAGPVVAGACRGSRLRRRATSGPSSTRSTCWDDGTAPTSPS